MKKRRILKTMLLLLGSMIWLLRGEAGCKIRREIANRNRRVLDLPFEIDTCLYSGILAVSNFRQDCSSMYTDMFPRHRLTNASGYAYMMALSTPTPA